MQAKHLTKEEKLNKESEEKAIITGREQLQKPPNWLIDSIAKKEFKRIVREFNAIELVGNLDLNNIACYCNAFTLYLKATKELEQQPLLVEKVLNNGVSTLAENPLVKIQKQYADEMRKFASLCGLTIDSRLKVAVQKTTEIDMEIESKFNM